MAEDLFREIVRVRESGLPAALATIVDVRGSTPGKLGQRMLVYPDGRILGTVGGGCLEADVIRTGREIMDTGGLRKMRFTLAGPEAERTGLACGGTLEIMIESLRESRLFVVGAGHVGRRIALLARATGFNVTLFDDRPDFADAKALPDLDRVVCAELDRVGEALDPNAADFLISVTRGHDHDYEILRWALGTPLRFIGVVGSRSKRIQFFRDLEAEGIAPTEFERVQCPVGLDIGAQNPEEIAVSVVAELVRRRRLGP
ncbi:MAG: XdhC/CoxI family protein [Planctomycetota bacterium]